MSLAVLSATRLPKVVSESSQQHCSFNGEGYIPNIIEIARRRQMNSAP
jgi:hypothetical protein